MKKLAITLFVLFFAFAAEAKFSFALEDGDEPKRFTPHILSTNLFLLASKTWSVNYEYIFDKKDFSIKFPINFSKHHRFNEFGLDLKFFTDHGKYEDVSIGVLKFKNSLFNWYLGPSYLFTKSYLETHSALRAMGGAMVQHRKGINASLDFAIGPGIFHTHVQRNLETTTTAENMFVSYTIGVNVGWRF